MSLRTARSTVNASVKSVMGRYFTPDTDVLRDRRHIMTVVLARTNMSLRTARSTVNASVESVMGRYFTRDKKVMD